jgi:SET domain-containing protein
MMIVPTYVGPSSIEGVGIFAAEDIRAGTPIWVLDETLDLLLTKKQLSNLPPLQHAFMERYGYPHMTRAGLTVLEFDNGRFMNHAASPNTDFRDPETGWAIRHIAAGEEITCNYAEFDPSFRMQPGRSFCAA